MDLSSLLQLVTVDCKDNQHTFTSKERIYAIQKILDRSSYNLLHEGKLCYIYGKKPIQGESVVLISSHIDCVYDRLFCRDYSEDLVQGTFDNSLTNACVLKNMLDDVFADNVIVAFTGNEEEDSEGAKEVMRIMSKWNTTITTAIVLDITEEGWEKQCPFTIENDLGIDIFKAHRIVELLKQYKEEMEFVHEAEPDESWEYDENDIPCFSLCVPILGDMHSNKGVLVRKGDLPIYCKIMTVLANGLADKTFCDKVYYIGVDGDEICGIYVNEDDCRTDNYIVAKTEDGVLKLPDHFRRRRIKGIKDFWCMGGQRTKTPPIKGLIIPESYRYVGQKNFSQYKYLEFVYLPQNVCLRSFAFAYCDQLKKVFVGAPDDYKEWCQTYLSPEIIYKGDQTHGIFERCHPDLRFYL